MKGAAHLRDPLTVIPRTALVVATPPGFAEEEAAPPTGTHEATAALAQTQPAGAEPQSFPGNADPPTVPPAVARQFPPRKTAAPTPAA